MGYLSIVSTSFPSKWYHCSLLAVWWWTAHSLTRQTRSLNLRRNSNYNASQSVQTMVKCHLQVPEIFSTVNAVFSEFKQILYRCKILPEPTGTNWCVVISHLSLIMLLINTITSPTYRNDRRTLFLKMPEDKFFSLFSSRVLLQENISKYRFSWSFKMIKDLNVSKY